MRFPSPWWGLKLALILFVSVGLPVGWIGNTLPPFFRIPLVGFWILVVAFFVAWFLVDRPIRELIAAVDRAEHYGFLNRARIRSRDLVGQLAKSFNRLLERVTALDAFRLERMKELAVINDFSQRIVSTLDLAELFQILDHLLGDQLGFQEFALLLRDEGADEVVVQIARGFADTGRVRGMSFRADEGLTGHVMKTAEACYIPDTSREPRYLYYKGEKREDGSFLSVPFLFKNKVVGILNFTRPGVDSFSSQEIQFLKTIAGEMAIAVANARLYSRTRDLAIRDELTGLYNRRHFQSVFPLEIKRSRRFGQPVSLLILDIDRFKQYNDSYGHPAGDERLREFAGLLKSKIREVDFIARYGGEEFVILLPNTAKKDAVAVADKLRLLARSHPYHQNPPDPSRPFTVSLGVAACPGDGNDIETLLAAADSALYQAKREGRDRVIAAQEFSSPSSGPPSTASSFPDFSGDTPDEMSASPGSLPVAGTDPGAD